MQPNFGRCLFGSWRSQGQSSLRFFYNVLFVCGRDTFRHLPCSWKGVLIKHTRLSTRPSEKTGWGGGVLERVCWARHDVTHRNAAIWEKPLIYLFYETDGKLVICRTGHRESLHIMHLLPVHFFFTKWCFSPNNQGININLTVQNVRYEIAMKQVTFLSLVFGLQN